MKTALLLLVAAFVANGQICNCYSDAGNGFYAGAECDRCDTAFTDKTVTAGQKCAGWSFCAANNPDRSELERTCYGQGVCNDNLAKPCNCTGNRGGTFCQECAAGFVGWPACSTTSCKADSCSGHGICDDAQATKSCGRSGYNPATQLCKKIYDPVALTSSYRAITNAVPSTDCKDAAGNIIEICLKTQTCVTTDPVTGELATPTCVDVGSTICYDIYGDNPKVCGPGSSCCDGECCSSAQTCSASSKSATVQFLYPGEDLPRAASVTAASGWLLPDGQPAEQIPRVCSSVNKMGGPAAVKVVVYPMLGMLGLLAGFGLVAKTTGLAPMGTLGAPALVSLFCCIFFLFTNKLFSLAYFVVLSCAVAMGAAHKGGSTYLYALVFQFLVLASMAGGFGLGSLFLNGSSQYQYASGSGTASWSEFTNCKRYYDYFTVAGSNPIWSSPDDRSWGYCSEGWFTYQMFAFGVCFLCQFVMLISTGLGYLTGSPKV